MKHLFIIIALIFTSCSQGQDLVAFPKEALNDLFLSEDGAEITLGAVLEKHKGKTILIDVWASWCRDCIEGMPKLKALQKDFKDVAFVFLSFDRSVKGWKQGIKKYDLKGDHYFVSSGWKSAFSKGIDLDWIPRYMVIDPSGKIIVYRAIEADDFRLKQAFETN